MNLTLLLHSLETVAARMCGYFISDVYCPEFTSEISTENTDDMNKRKLVFHWLRSESQFQGRFF
jgi:hypothetical protein